MKRHRSSALERYLRWWSNAQNLLYKV